MVPAGPTAQAPTGMAMSLGTCSPDLSLARLTPRSAAGACPPVKCCADATLMRGRPVAAAIADATGWDAWESSHLGGHRFAATAGPRAATW